MIWLVLLLIFLGFMMTKGLASFGINAGLKMLSVILPVFFLADYMLLFFCFLELSLVPLFLMILNSGYQPERLNSSVLMFLYTVLGSSPLLYFIYKTLEENMVISNSSASWGMDLSYTGTLVLLTSVMAFLVKIPMFNFHLWLPKAHVEAPVQGSAILAGVMLKLGGYGLFVMLIKFLFFKSLICVIFIPYCLAGAILMGFTCILQKDGKSLIAYSSVVHMMVMVIGIISMSNVGQSAAFGSMVGHGLVSPSLFYIFFCFSGVAGTRSLVLLKGSGSFSYKMKLMWWLAIIANMACPPFFNLLMEINLVVTVLASSFSFILPLLLVMVSVSLYTMVLYLLSQLFLSEWGLCAENLKISDMVVVFIIQVFLVTLSFILQFYY